MKAIIPEHPGAPEVLKIQEVDVPQPRNDEVLVKVKAFGLNKAESYNRQGKHGAFSGSLALGIEAAGEIEFDPQGILAKGQRVVTAMGGMMFNRHGSYAEYISVKRSNIVVMNSALDIIRLATLPEAYLTAWGALNFNLKLQPNETLLVRGGTTTVGMAAISLAKRMGAKVIATTRQPDRVEKLKALGADDVIIDAQRIGSVVRDIFPSGVDKAIELVGGVTLKDTLQSVKKWGEVAFVGFVGGTAIVEQFHMMNDMPNTVKLSFFGSGILGTTDLPITSAPLNDIADAIYRNEMPSIHARTFKFEDIIEAHKYLESNKAFGKIVVEV